MPAHTCPSWPCPICFPEKFAGPYWAPGYVLPPVPQFTPQGCICPPGCEQTCLNPTCPRGGGQPIKIT